MTPSPFAKAEKIGGVRICGTSPVYFESAIPAVVVKELNSAFHARCAPLVEALERIERRTLLDAEGPELRCQNENNYKDARKALEAFNGK